MNKEGEYIAKTACQFCKYKKHNQLCINADKGKCKNFEAKHGH